MAFVRLGNALWLDFVNTEVMSRGCRVDLLSSPEALARWLEASLEPDSFELEHARRIAGVVPDGERVLRQACQLRLDLREMAEGAVRGEAPGEASFRSINEVLASSSGHASLRRRGSRTISRFVSTSTDDRLVLRTVAESAMEFVLAGEPGRVRQCRGADCILFFVDGSKNSSRRWCSMTTCGNRSKSHTHYRKRRAG